MTELRNSFSNRRHFCFLVFH